MGLFTLLFGKKKSRKGETVKLEIMGKSYDTGVTQEQINQFNSKPVVGVACSWVESNQVEMVRSDEHKIYKINRVSPEQRNQIGFYGQKWYSENGEFCVVYSSIEEGKYNVGLVDVLKNTVAYRIKLTRPHRCLVSNNGIVVCEDWGNIESKTSYILALGTKGQILAKNAHREAVGDNFSISDDGRLVNYTLNYSGKNVKLNLEF